MTAPSPSFSELSAQVGRSPRGPDIPEHWKQGRTAYGGLSAGLLLAKARADHAGLPPLRSALVNFTGPVSGAPLLGSRLLRAGRNVSTVTADATLDGGTVCTATFSFGQSRDSALDFDVAAPPSGKPEDHPPMIPKDQTQFAPGFTVNFDSRLCAGARPITGAKRGHIRCWVRHRDAASRTGEAALLCLADILPPAAMPMLKTFGPVSSMTWICNVLRSPETDDGWYLVEAEANAARGGYSSQLMRIWNSAGELVVEGMQSIVIFA